MNKTVVLFLLEAIKDKGLRKISTVQLLKEIIENKENSDEYVYKCIYDKTPYIYAKDVDTILSLLEENNRI